MDYLEYFEKFPDAYAKVVGTFDREHTLYDFLVQSGALEGAENVLSIGPGDGKVEVRLAKEHGIQLGIVEPSGSLFAEFVAHAQAANIEGQILEAVNTSFEQYHSGPKYDSVLSLFSWFAFGFDKAALDKALACLRPGGKLIIIIQDEASPSTRISAMSRSGGIQLTSEALSQWATNEGHPHLVSTYHGLVPAETYLADDGFAEAGRDLVSFLLATPWDEIPVRLKGDSFAAFQQACDGQHVDLSAGVLIFEKA